MKSSQICKNIIIILGVWYLGYIVHLLIPVLPIVINAFVIMFILLCLKIIKEDSLKAAEEFFIPIIGIFFIPSMVEIYFLWDKIQNQFLLFFLFLMVSFLCIFGVTFFTARLLIKLLYSKKT